MEWVIDNDRPTTASDRGSTNPQIASEIEANPNDSISDKLFKHDVDCATFANTAKIKAKSWGRQDHSCPRVKINIINRM
jgi:hypothetical protein